jgi:hypothetical protein
VSAARPSAGECGRGILAVTYHDEGLVADRTPTTMNGYGALVWWTSPGVTTDRIASVPVHASDRCSCRGRAGLALAFLLALGVSFVLAEATKDRCDNVVGRLAVRLKLDSYYSGCRCMTHSMDFSDPCNSMYGF